MRKEYLGDAVYIEITEWGEIKLTTENGEHTTNVIILDGAVVGAFEEYIKRIRNQQ